MDGTYVHGYGAQESVRLQDQARTLEALLHADIRFPPGTRVLEAGCGTGAQTLTLARNSPGAQIIAIDRSTASLDQARARIDTARLTNVSLRQADLAALTFGPDQVDHVFVCFVLEHLPQPVEALRALERVLKPGGTITVIEGDHGTASFHPDSAAARAAIGCLVALQARTGGDALIGRRLTPLLRAAGLTDIAVVPRSIFADASRPALVDGFIERTFVAMVEAVGPAAVAAGLTDAAGFAAGVADLRRTAEPDGSFLYTFFKATATKART